MSARLFHCGSLGLMGFILAAAVGCSGPAATPGQPTVQMHWHSFEPASLTIEQGQTVKWHNATLIPHTVTCDPQKAKKAEDVSLPSGAQTFDSGDVFGEYEHAFTVAGTYNYVCVPHETMGMKGTVIVKPATQPSPQPSTLP